MPAAQHARSARDRELSAIWPHLRAEVGRTIPAAVGPFLLQVARATLKAREKVGAGEDGRAVPQPAALAG